MFLVFFSFVSAYRACALAGWWVGGSGGGVRSQSGRCGAGVGFVTKGGCTVSRVTAARRQPGCLWRKVKICMSIYVLVWFFCA